MSKGELRRVTILPFSTRRPPPRVTVAVSQPQASVDPSDPVSLVMAQMEVLVRLRDYATVTQLLATQLLEMSADVGLIINNAADVYSLATTAERDAANAEAYRHDLEPWLDEIRDRAR